MPRFLLPLVLSLFFVPLLRADGPETHTIKLNGHTFTLPVGLTIELAAGPKMVQRPIHADFDEKGFLYVVDSSGSNEPVQQQLEKKPHQVVRLQDTTGSGKFDKRTIYADKMMFPEGAMWRAGSLYVAAPPSIWKLTDTDGDGVADKREEWFKGKTLTNCANDLHGPYNGPDGWIYWCKGAFAKQEYERPGKAPFVTRAAHVFRCRPDGTGIEAVMSGGMDNPVELVFTPGGERIFNTTFFQHPGGGKRDGLVHAIYGGVYGKDHAVIHEHPWTSPELMPVMTHMGAAAPAGLMRYESDVFGKDYKDNLFCAQFNMHKISRHVLVPDGATFKTIDSDLLVSDNFDFHPTDVLEDADGSILVIDTGGWYKLCCPTSQLAKPDISGAIYRIRKNVAAKVEDPRGLKLDWKKPKPKWLEDERPAVRKRSIEAFAEMGNTAIPVLDAWLKTPATTAEGRRNAVWAGTRIDSTEAKIFVRTFLNDPDDAVRQAALHSISLRRDVFSLEKLHGYLQPVSAMNRRVASEAIGRIGKRESVSFLLLALGMENDWSTAHSLTYALIEIGDVEETVKGLADKNPTVRRGALIALDQMEGKHLKFSQLAKALDDGDAKVREAAWWIAGLHPDWGTELAGALRAKWMKEPKDAPFARFASSEKIQELMAELMNGGSDAGKQAILQAMREANLKQAPTRWIDALVTSLAEESNVPAVIATIRALKIPPKEVDRVAAALLKAGDNPVSATNRLTLLAAVPGGLKKVDKGMFLYLLEARRAGKTEAAEVLGRAKLDSEQLTELAGELKLTGPLEIDKLLEAFAQSKDAKVGEALLASLKDSKARTSLRVDQLKPRLAPFGPALAAKAEELYVLLNADGEKQKAKLDSLLPRLKEGDIRRGQAVFKDPKLACATCHAMGYLGGTIGPDLTHIGKIRTERDLLESILFPSASLVRSYEPLQVTLKSGKQLNGVPRGETATELVLQIDATRQERIPRSDIEEILPGKVSIMPAGLDQQLSEKELLDLVAFLKSRQ